MNLMELPDIEASELVGLLITAGGQLIKEPLDEALSKRLTALWDELGIRDIEIL